MSANLSNISKSKLREAEAIAARIPEILEQRGLEPAFSDWFLTDDRGLLVLFGVLDVARVQRLEQYAQSALIHHISTAIGGRQVAISNTSGMRYAVLLSTPPRLPRQVPFPGLHRGAARLGVRFTGEPVEVPWERLGHLLVAGKTGSGKSTFLRLLAYQGLAEGASLLLADRDGATFPMLAGHPALLAPIAQTPAEMLQAVEQALGECDHRAACYQQAAGFPEKLEEYNAAATKAGGAPLPRLLVILDEFNAAALAAGGAKGPLARAVAELGWRGRKFGVNLTFAAQDFTMAIVGRVRDQVGATICFCVKNAATARAVGCEDAVKIPERRPGLAITDRWGPLQAYYLEKRLLIRAGAGQAEAPLNNEERSLIERAQEHGGRMTIPLLSQLGLSEWKARQLLKDWELRGWVAKDAQRDNARYVTDKLLDLAGLRPD